jgi:signal transduction histidine kinase
VTWQWNPLAVGPMVCSILTLAIAALIWSRRQVGPTYAPVSLAAGAWSMGVGLMACTTDQRLGLVLSRFALSGILLAGFFAMRFATFFARTRRRRPLMLLSAATSLIGLGMVWFDAELCSQLWNPPWGGVYPLLGSHAPLFVLMGLLGVLGPGVIALRLWLRLPPSRRQRQAAYICLAYAAATLGGIDILGATGHAVPPLTWASSTLSVALFYYAMARWRLLDVRTAVHRTLFWVLVIAATLLPLYALALATAGWPGWNEPVARALAVASTMMLLIVYVARIEPFALGLLGRRATRMHTAVDAFAARAARTRSPDELPALVDDALAQLGGLSLSAVLVSVDAGGQRLELTLPEGTRAPPVPVAEAAPAEPLSCRELDPDDPEAAPANAGAARLCAAYAADAVLPMRHRDVVVGVLLLRETGRATPGFDEVKRDALARLAARAAVAFINAALEEALARRSARLEQEVEERTRALAGAVEELKAAQARLVQAERQSSLGVLVAGVSHEINNALNFIFGNLPMMAKYVDDYADFYARAGGAGATPKAETVRRAEEARAQLMPALQAIERSADRARAIVGDLRRFARADDAERKPTDVREGLESTLNLLGPELGGRVEIERRFAESLPRIDGYPAALNHVFLNVLINALQAIEGTGRIIIDTRVDERGRVEVGIADTGRGVPHHERERLFDPFVTTRSRAAGLGLAVSRQIVARHGGDIRLEDSPYGPGTRVTISLPVTSDHPSRGAAEV